MFSFQVEVLTDDGKQEFQAESNMHWEDFHSHVLAYLGSASDKIELIYINFWVIVEELLT